MELSIYKLSSTRELFIDILQTEYNLRRLGSSVTIPSTKILNNNIVSSDIIADFYFKSDQNEVEIEWINYWASLFAFNRNISKTVESSFGVVVIQIGDELYAISLGRGHHYTNKIADLDFGLDIAEMILDEDSIEVKSAKFFKQSKNKALTQYNRNSYVTFEIGESNELVIGKATLDTKYSHFILFNYVSKMKFGTAIKIEVNDYEPKEIIDIVHEIHCIYNQENKVRRINLPRIIFLKDNEDNSYRISDLNKKLLEEILKGDSINLSLSYYIEDGGDIIIEPTNEDKIELIYNRKKEDIIFDINSIRKSLIKLDCSDITKVYIRSKSNTNNSIQIIKLLDFITEYQEKSYCLYKGKWANFNDSYLIYIENEIKKVNDCASYDSRFDLTSERLEEGIDLMKSGEEYDNVNYAEYPYNIYLHKKLNYKLLDRKSKHKLFKTIEFADLYDHQEETLIHVKIGSNKDLRYCIQQSLRSSEIFNRHNNVLDVYDINIVKNICMLFILESDNIIASDNSIDFSKNKSIYFKVEIIEWFNRMRDQGYNPKIIIAKDLRA